MIQIKNQYVNHAKMMTVQFATNKANDKSWLIVTMDAQSKELSKLFIEITGESEYLAIIEQIKNQLNK